MIRNRRLLVHVAITVAVLSLAGTAPVFGQTGGVGLNPARREVEILPGSERTVAFRIEPAPSQAPVQGRILLSPTDWTISEHGTVSYTEPGTTPDSASSWMTFSPSALTISSGQSETVRVTVKVPELAKPGVYRTAIFIQERPPATPPAPGQYVLYVRFRYVFTLYVIVPPVSAAAEFLNVHLDAASSEVLLEMTNTGALHLRPRFSWSIHAAGGTEISAARAQESMVLLPGSSLTQRSSIPNVLPAGRYEVVAQVDFNNGRPAQVIRRQVEILPMSQTHDATSN